MESSFSILYTQAFRIPAGRSSQRDGYVSRAKRGHSRTAVWRLRGPPAVPSVLSLGSCTLRHVHKVQSPPGTQQPPETRMTQFYGQNWPGFRATFASPCGSQRPAFFLQRRAAAATRRQLLAGWQGPGLGQQGRAWRPGCLRGFAPRPPPAP